MHFGTKRYLETFGPKRLSHACHLETFLNPFWTPAVDVAADAAGTAWSRSEANSVFGQAGLKIAPKHAQVAQDGAKLSQAKPETALEPCLEHVDLFWGHLGPFLGLCWAYRSFRAL